MKLIVAECRPSLFQIIRATEPMFLVSVRPHLYIHGSPTGTVKIQIHDASGKFIAESSALTITGLKTEAYAHGYFRFDLDANLIADTSYRVVVVCGSGYAFSESAYVGVCLDWDDTKTDLGYTSTGSFDKPLDIELWFREIK